MDVDEANKFINSLVKNLQVLCHGHVSFNSSIQVIGHLYLNVDSNTNIDYIVNEKVCKSDTSSTMFVSKSYHSEPPKKLKDKADKNRQTSQSDSNSDMAQEQPPQPMSSVRMERLNFSRAFTDMPFGQKTSTPTHHAHRRPSFHTEGPSHKVPRLSSNMSPSHIKNSHHTGFRQDNRNVMGDNSSHHSDISRLQQSNISDTSFHLPASNTNTNSPSQRSSISTLEDSSLPKVSIKEEPVHIDLSRVKSEPDDNDGNDDTLGEMTNEEFIASLQDKSTSIYPVGLHSNQSQFDQHNFSLPVHFQHGAGGGASASSTSDGSNPNIQNYGISNPQVWNEWKALNSPRTRTYITRQEKKELCEIHEGNPNFNTEEICEAFSKKFGKKFRPTTVYYILKTKEKWLSDTDS